MNLQENATNNYIQYFSSDFNIQRTVIDLPLSLLLEHQVRQNIVYFNLKHQIFIDFPMFIIGFSGAFKILHKYISKLGSSAAHADTWP